MFKRSQQITIVDAFADVVFIIMILIGVFMISVGGFRAYEAYSSQIWPTVKGEILASRVEILGSNSGRTYRSYVRYGYEAGSDGNGSSWYEGEQMGPDAIEKRESRFQAEAELAPYPKGAIIDVYYNPNRPDRSMLEPVFELPKLIQPTIGLLVLFGALMLKFINRNGKLTR